MSAERQRLLERLRTVRVDRLECLVLLGRFAEALDDLATLSVSGPYDESLAALCVRALYGSERQVDALGRPRDMCAPARRTRGRAR
ncbi:BTAD domain-containing putative transcriptional regulator [Streptomyces sp. NPDC055134]